MKFNSERHWSEIEQLMKAHQIDAPSVFWVAYSGGLDSTVLLHALAEQRDRLGTTELKAIHVHHGLQAQADAWVEHCRAVCGRLQLPLVLRYVDARPKPGQSPEAAAREARYAALAAEVGQSDVLFTAHQQDDQIETLMLQLLRGAGPRGMAAMPRVTRFARGYLLRSLLDYTRDELEAWAQRQSITTWVEDPSNLSNAYDRNYLRNEIMPRLHERWPGAIHTLARAAEICAETVEIIDHMAQEDWMAVATNRTDRLKVPALLELSPARRNNVLLYWIRKNNFPLPSAAQLTVLVRDILGAAWDKTPLLEFGNTQIRRHRDIVFIMPAQTDVDRSAEYTWDMTGNLEVPGCGQLRVQRVEGKGLAPDALHGKKLVVRFRQGGEKLCLPGKTHRQSLKKLLQESALPPWERENLLLLYADEEIAAVIGHWIAHDFVATADQQGLLVSIESGSNQG